MNSKETNYYYTVAFIINIYNRDYQHNKHYPQY